ncbi:class I SAM-dependent methyltransferase [Candidatus Pelagibacter bacterium nBUS_28]|uniref:class I SAM-dependent methyltransferase n=1 Tax=Candidatus Pelagibacter bacterium nBUS_28 TaxID=3374189 RepID=UPI003EB81042
MPDIKDVEEFWNNNPLWTGETKFETGSFKFFEDHRKTVINDCFAGALEKNCFPALYKKDEKFKILDLGCGIGFWLIEFKKRGYKNLYAVDLSKEAIKLTKKRLNFYNYKANLSIQNAENLNFENEMFDHVNCQGVIHHTPNTIQCVSEINRILKPNGTANISVYYKKFIIRNWKILRFLSWPLFLFGIKFKGRGRESIFKKKNINKIVRLYYGKDNPIGKVFSKRDFIKMLEKYFIIDEINLHFFPTRIFPFKIPLLIKKYLDKHLGFMIYASIRKK